MLILLNAHDNLGPEVSADQFRFEEHQLHRLFDFERDIKQSQCNRPGLVNVESETNEIQKWQLEKSERILIPFCFLLKYFEIFLNDSLLLYFTFIYSFIH